MSRVAERRSGTATMITVNEAAFAAGVSVKAVNQAIDREHIQTRALQRATDRARRGIGASDAVYLAVRQVLAPDLWPKLYRSFRGKTVSELPRRFEVGAVVIDLERAIEEVEDRLRLLDRIAERVEVDPEVRGGEPVFRGTRTPVHAIARKIELGSSSEELREDYPQLQEDDLDLATKYAKLYPRRGRPRTEGMRGLKGKGAGPAA
jgi:uncharacterized protein (DUF433 family)